MIGIALTDGLRKHVQDFLRKHAGKTIIALEGQVHMIEEGFGATDPIGCRFLNQPGCINISDLWTGCGLRCPGDHLVEPGIGAEPKGVQVA